MSRRIVRINRRIAACGNHLAAPHDHRTDRDFTRCGGCMGLGKREAHKTFVAHGATLLIAGYARVYWAIGIFIS